MNRSERRGTARISQIRLSRGSRSRSSQQSVDVLNPSAFSIEAAEKWALEKVREVAPEPFRLTAYFHIDYIVQQLPRNGKRATPRGWLNPRTTGLAFGLAPSLPDLDPDFVGRDVRQILKDRLCRDNIDRTAFVDLVMGHLSQSANEYVTLEGAVQDKYLARARIFAGEAEKIIERKGVKRLRETVHVLSSSERPGPSLAR